MLPQVTRLSRMRSWESEDPPATCRGIPAYPPRGFTKSPCPQMDSRWVDSHAAGPIKVVHSMGFHGSEREWVRVLGARGKLGNLAVIVQWAETPMPLRVGCILALMVGSTVSVMVRSSHHGHMRLSLPGGEPPGSERHVHGSKNSRILRLMISDVTIPAITGIECSIADRHLPSSTIAGWLLRPRWRSR